MRHTIMSPSELLSTYVAVQNNCWHCIDTDILGPLVSGWKWAPVCCQALGHRRAIHWALHCSWALHCILHCGHCIVQFEPCIVHSTLYTVLYIPLCAQYCTFHFVHSNVHSTLCTVLYIPLCEQYCTFHFVHSTEHCTSDTVLCIMGTALYITFGHC